MGNAEFEKANGNRIIPVPILPSESRAHRNVLAGMPAGEKIPFPLP
jgi:hypothetical protein